MNRRRLFASVLAAAALPHLSAAQTPAASPAPSSDIRLVDMPGRPLALSPDGTMIAGFGDRDTIRIWDSVTLEIVTESDPFPEISRVDERSLTWSPDNTAIAWSLNAAQLLVDSDIYVLDLVSGTSTNLTNDEPTDKPAISLLRDDAEGYVLDVDVYPTWSADGESLLFARTTWDDTRGTTLYRIPRGGGDVEELSPVSPDIPLVVSSMWAGMDDGSVLFTTWPPDIDDPAHGLFLMSPDGATDGISTGMLMQETPLPILLDIAPTARKASMVSQINYGTLDLSAGPIWFEMDLDTGIPTAFEEILSLPAEIENASSGDRIMITAPAFLTDEDGAITGYLHATSDLGFEEYTLRRHEIASGESISLGTFRKDDGDASRPSHFSRIETGANGTAAIFHGGHAWLANVAN